MRQLEFFRIINQLERKNITKIVNSEITPQDKDFNLDKIYPICPGTTMYLRTAIFLTLNDFYKYRISAETAKNNLQIYQLTTETAKKKFEHVNNNQLYIKLWYDLSDIISGAIYCIEELSERHAYLFSLHLKNKDYILAEKLLGPEKNGFFLKKDYEKCQQSLQPYLPALHTLKNPQSNSYCHHIFANIKKYLFLSISLFKSFIPKTSGFN